MAVVGICGSNLEIAEAPTVDSKGPLKYAFLAFRLKCNPNLN